VDDADIDGKTVLMWAAFHNRLAVAQYLLLEGADIGLRDKVGKSAEDWALEGNATILARYLNEVMALIHLTSKFWNRMGVGLAM